MNETCEIVYILDRSGSMHGLEADTIGGFNGMIEKQRKEGLKAVVSVSIFDDKNEIVVDREDLSKVPELTSEVYYTRGCTALFDAVGEMISRVDDSRKSLSKDECPSRTMFIITTDGMENASHEFSGKAVKSLIEAHKQLGWEFLYLGANIDAAAEAEKIGIGADRAVRFHADSKGIRKNMEVLADSVVEFANCEAPLSADWKKRIEDDYCSRKAER